MLSIPIWAKSNSLNQFCKNKELYLVFLHILFLQCLVYIITEILHKEIARKKNINLKYRIQNLIWKVKNQMKSMKH
jgi:hypothetical protein